MASTTDTPQKGAFLTLRHFIALAALVALTAVWGAPAAHAATATLSWSAPGTNSDGTPLTDLAGYKVYVGSSPGAYDTPLDVGNTTSYTVTNLPDGMTHYFAITAYNSSNMEGALSNVVSKNCPTTGYLITATAGSGGSISAANNANVSTATSGGSTISSVSVAAGASQSFAITPASGYAIASVTVNGTQVGSVASYSFANVSANQSISATFTPTSAAGSTGSAGSATGTAASFAVNSGGTQYTDASGTSYATDASYSGGSVATVTSAISGTSDQALYQSERYGNFSYNVALPNGSYAVTLKFAETYWSAAGQRVFNVSANGQTVISNLDVFAKVGKNAAYDVTVPVTVSNGTLALAFNTVVDNAKVSAIVVKPATAATSGTTAFAANAGGSSYVGNGVRYATDTLYTGGTSASTTAAISGTSDQALYQTERYGNFTYNIPLANGSYSVVLKFAETYWTAAGQRVFNVAANGQTVISNLDIFAKVGANAAYDVTVPVTVSNGTLSLAFTTVVDNAKVSAILVQPASATATPAASGAVFAGNAGGAAYVGGSGTRYAADSLYTGGTTASTTAAISGTSDPTVYQSERYGNFTYNIPVANGSYAVVLKFAETYWSAAGQRVFSVAANGQTVISNLDIYAKAGANTAYDVTVPVTVTNGTLSLAFTSQVDNAKVSAIVVQPAAAAPASAVAFASNAGGSSFVTASGTSYLADTGFSGGSTASTTAAISGTADQALYQSERYGNFSYSIPVSNGSYAVKLKFAETYWTAAGERVFNVGINGANVISNLDIFAKVGANAAYDVEVPVTVTNGALKIDFATVVDNAKVSAIEVRKL